MRFLLLMAALFLAGCSLSPPIITPAITPVPTRPALPTAAPQPSVSVPDPTSTPDPATAPAFGQWESAFPGVERLQAADGLLALRHAPLAVRYAAYFEPDPDKNRTTGGWLLQDPDALAAVNCGFYRNDGGHFAHIGLLMVNDIPWSDLRSQWGGVLIVRDGEAFIAARPQRLLAPATLGIQGWPMLVQNRTRIPRLDATDVARRTAVGVDIHGNVLWIVAPQGATLAEFASRLTKPDLNLTDAVNLDGGASTGLRWRSTPDASPTGPDSLPIPCAIRLMRF